MGTIADKITYLGVTKGKIKDVINMTGAGIDSQTTFRNYAQALYNGYINVLKDRNTLLDNMNIGTSTGSITDSANLPIYEDKMSKLSSQETSILPSGYTQVDYIQSSGTQYINTGVLPTATINISTKCYITNYTNTRNYVCGSLQGNNNRYQICFLGDDANNNFLWGYASGTTRALLDITDHYKTITTDGKKCIIDNTEVSVNSTTFTTAGNLYLFGANSSGSADYISNGIRIYWFKIYDNNVLVRDFIPCYRNSDNKVGMYDLVNDVFYTNQGTGEFTYGGVVSIPNPNFPQEINTVKGYRNELSYPDDFSITRYGSTFSGSKGTYIVENTPSSDTQYSFFTLTNSYTIQQGDYLHMFNDEIINGSLLLIFSDNSQRAPSFNAINKIFDLSLSVGKTITKIGVDVRSNNTFTKLTFSPMIINKSTVIPYVPYGTNWIYTTISGKNLFDKNNITSGNYLNSSGALVESEYWSISNYIKVNANDIIYYNGLSNVGTAPYSVYYDENKNYISSFKQATGEQKITIPNNVYYIRFSIFNENINDFNVNYKNITTIPLNDNEVCGIGDYKDELIVDKNGHCWLNKKIGKVVLDGEENWSFNSSSSIKYRLSISNFMNETDQSKVPMLLSNYYQSYAWNNTVSHNYAMTSEPTVKQICFRNIDINTLEDWKTWLSTHNTDVYYVLETSQLIDLNYNVDLTLYEGSNTITNSEDMDMEIKYIKNVYE